jgi:peroxiredoxin Q/BCP
LNKQISIVLGVLLAASSLACGPGYAKDETKDGNSAMEKESQKAVKEGMKAPDFTLPSQDGSSVSLHDFVGKSPVVLYFYPKDETPICTKEACAFQASLPEFKDLDAVVIGVSADSVDSHKEFAQKHNLSFALLSDKDNQVRKLYGVHSTMGLMPGRVTYVIDKDGVVKTVFSSQLEAEKHVKEALAGLKQHSNSQ